MKIVLFALNASYSHTNLAVRGLRQAIRAVGRDAVIREHTLKDRRDDVLHGLYAEEADLYGFSVYIWNADEMYRYASALKQLRPGAKMVFGGPEVSFAGEEFFALHPYADHLIRGEGENAWIGLAAGEQLPPIIEGSAYAGFDGQGILYDDAPPGSIVYYESSRGCPYRCAFCLSGSLAQAGQKLRAKSAGQTLADLLAFNRFPQVKVVKLVDRTFNFDRERAKTIWRALLDEQYRLHYHFEICAELLDEESFALLERFPPGKIQLEIGVQSTNPATLAAVNRPSDTARVIAAARRIHAMGNIHVHCDLIAGLPHESYDRFGQSFDDLHGSCTMLQLGFLKVLQGSALRRRAGELGLIFARTPPYQILSTPDIGYDQLHRLEKMAAVLERLETSGQFSRTCRCIFAHLPSPFRFYEEFSRFLGQDVSALSQNALVERIAAFFGESDFSAALEEALVLDYLTGCLTPLPPRLKGRVIREEREAAFRRRYLEDCRAGGIPAQAGGLEVLRFAHKKDTVFCVDRVRHVIKEYPDE